MFTVLPELILTSHTGPALVKRSGKKRGYGKRIPLRSKDLRPSFFLTPLGSSCEKTTLFSLKLIHVKSFVKYRYLIRPIFVRKSCPKDFQLAGIQCYKMRKTVVAHGGSTV